jgi:hypothetical protein
MLYGYVLQRGSLGRAAALVIPRVDVAC